MAIQINPTFPGYAQIQELVAERILTGEYSVGGRVPSVRDMAVELEVNPITVVRAYERLQRAEIIFTKRGLGYFVSEGALEEVRKSRQERFWHEMMPAVESEMSLLSITPEELLAYLNNKTT